MKQSYKFLLVLVSITLLSLYSFGQGFVHKTDKTINRIRSSYDFRKLVKFSDLFTYPDDIGNKDTIAENSAITISFSSTNESNLFFDRYYYSRWSGQYFYYKVPADVYGYDTLTINITYKGITATSLLIVNTNAIKCKNDNYTISIGDTIIKKITTNDTPKNYLNFASTEIIVQPHHGSVSLFNDTIKYINNTNTQNYTIDSLIYRIADTDGNYDTAKVTFDIHYNSYVSKVFEYLPGCGQFVNTSWADTAAAKKIIGNTYGGVSLGGFGGYIIAGFDQPIVNREKNPYGVDFTVVGNAFSNWGEPAAVMVMKDENGNGLPDDTWYELAGSEYYFDASIKNLTMTYINPKYNKRHSIPYKTNKGFNGIMRTNGFHRQQYYPDPYSFNISPDSVSYTGTFTKYLLDKSNPHYIVAKRLPYFGYADCHQSNSTPTKPHNPYFKDENGNVADGFDLEWAVDENGNHVDLDTVHFVKVYSTVQEDGGWLGEVSPEIFKIAITTPDPDYVKKNYKFHSIGMAQLQVLKETTMQMNGLLFKNGIPQNGTANWTSSNTDIATIDNNGLFTALDTTGTTTIKFYVDKNIEPDSIIINVVKLKSINIPLDTLKIIKGETDFIYVDAIDNRTAPKNHFVYEQYNWTISNANIGTIENGIFIAKNTGTAKIAAQSVHNPTLKDTIVVVVNDIPIVETVKDTVIIPFNTREKTFKSSDLFKVKTNAIVFLQSFTFDTTKLNAKKINNDFNITFNSGIYDYERINFTVKSYNKEQQVSIVFKRKEPPVEKLVLFVNGGEFTTSEDPAVPTELKCYIPKQNNTVTIDDYLAGASSVQDMIVDGNIAYVSADYFITRYEMAANIATDSIYTQDTSSVLADGTGNKGAGVNHKMVIYKNMLLVTRQNSSAAPQDGYNVRIYNKADLSLIKKIPVSNQATDIVIAGDTAFVMINGGFAGTTSSLAVIDLTTLSLNREVNLGTKGLGVMQMILHNNKIYCIRLKGVVTSYSSGVIVYDIANGNVQEFDFESGIPYDSSPLAIEPMTNDTLFVKKDLGYVAFNTQTNTFGTEKFFSIPKRYNQDLNHIARGAVYDKETQQYYIVYGYWQGNGVGQVYGKSKDSIGYFDGVGASPEVVKICNLLQSNNYPVAQSQDIKIYAKTKELFKYTLPENLFIDDEDGSVNTYLYNPAQYNWIKLKNDTIIGLYPDLIGKTKNIELTLQSFDKNGGFINKIITLILNDDVPPTVANSIPNISVNENAADSIIPLANVFTDADNDDSQIVKTVKNNTNQSLVNTSISGNNLTLSFTPNSIGQAEIVIEAESNGKTITDTFSVTITKDMPPVVAIPIPNILVKENSADSVISLTNVFTDADNDDSQIVKTVKSNTNQSLVNTSISGNNLTLSFTPNSIGQAEIVIEAVSNGKTVTDTFNVTVTKESLLAVVNPIPDISVKENSADTTISLVNVFTYTGKNNLQIIKTVKSNSNQSLVNTSISGNNLTLSFTPNSIGQAEIVIEAESFSKTVTDTFNVTVNEDISPIVVNPIPDISVNENAGDSIISLTNVFTDADNDDSQIVKTVKNNSNQSLVNTSISGNNLTLSFAANSHGQAEIVIEAESNGKTITDTFNVTIIEDVSPIVVNPIPDISVNENASDSVISLVNVFADADNDDSQIVKTVKSNSNQSLVNTSISGNNLTLSFIANSHGQAEIVIEAESNGKTVTDTFNVTVLPTSIYNNITGIDYIIYPNPTNGKFRIKTNNNVKNTVVSIYSLQGKLVYYNKFYSNSEIIDISLLPAGAYKIRIIQNNEIVIKTIIIK